MYDSTLVERVPQEFRGFTLHRLVNNQPELEQFRQFLSENYASLDLNCWQDIEAYRRLTDGQKQLKQAKAKEIKTKYLNKKYFFGTSSPAGRAEKQKVRLRTTHRINFLNIRKN